MPAASRQSGTPHAIVLCMLLTGLATARALARQGVAVHAIVFDPRDPLRVSRYPKSVSVLDIGVDDAALLAHIRQVAAGMPHKPALLVTCDRMALFVARHRLQLSRTCRVWTTPFTALADIIEKERLYDLAQRAGVPLIPWTRCDDPDELAAWLADNPPPYIVKPSFAGKADVELSEKNRTMQTREQFLQFLNGRNGRGLLIQRLLKGGDGEIYDTYGYCDAQGLVRTICTHRRLRQQPPHFGTTTYGEIPSRRAPSDDIIIDHTLKLLSKAGYHGIFGIEWLRDTSTGLFYLIDFNARPFGSIGHLEDCGLNLPWVAVRDLMGDPLSDLPLKPELPHLLWVNMIRDMQSRRAQPRSERLPLLAWLRSVWLAKGYAYLDWHDWRPTLHKARAMLPQLLRTLAQR